MIFPRMFLPHRAREIAARAGRPWGLALTFGRRGRQKGFRGVRVESHELLRVSFVREMMVVIVLVHPLYRLTSEARLSCPELSITE